MLPPDDDAAETLSAAVGATPEPIRPRIGGVVYDWDLWPWWVAGGVGMDEVVVLALKKNMRRAMVNLGLPLYAAIRKIPKGTPSLLRQMAEAEDPTDETSTARE